MTGPALGGVEERWSAFPKKDLYSWIRNSQALVSAGHPRAVEVFNQYNKILMNSFTGLTDDEIASMLLYIDAQAKGGDKPQPGAGGAVALEDTKKESSTPWMFVGLAVILGLLAFALMRIIDNLGNVTRVQAGEQPIRKDWTQSLTSKGFIAFLIFSLTLIFGYKTVDNATRMQRQQGFGQTTPGEGGDDQVMQAHQHDQQRGTKEPGLRRLGIAPLQRGGHEGPVGQQGPEQADDQQQRLGPRDPGQPRAGRG